MCCRFIDQIDRLVRQTAITDVTVGKPGGSRHRRIGDRHAVMQLIALLHTPQDLNAVVDRRLGDLHLLEATVQCRILFNRAAVILWCGGRDATQIPSGQCGLEQAASVGAGAIAVHHGVQFVDEQHHTGLGITHLLQHFPQPFLKLTAKLGASDQGTHIQGNKPESLKRFRNFTRHDALGQQLSDGGLAHARRPNQNRVVLAPTREHLDQAADLTITTDHGIQESLRCSGSEVTGITIERCGLRLSRRIQRQLIDRLLRSQPGLHRFG